MNNLRTEVVELMVEIHRMPYELAVDHVIHMDDIEVSTRFQTYTGMALSETVSEFEYTLPWFRTIVAKSMEDCVPLTP